MLTMMLTAQAIIREKEIGTLEQLMVTPMRPDRADAGKNVAICIGWPHRHDDCDGCWTSLFHIAFRGSFLLLLFALCCI